jgi:putative phage-type endonuclease
MKVITAEQGSPEWLAARAGKVTASMISNVLAKPETAAYRDYQAQIVAELLTGKPQGSDFTNEAMQFGTENEPFARSAYEVSTGFTVDEVGLVLHPTIDRAGASPDGLVGSDGLVEIKCPKVATHLAYICAGVVPTKYKNQMLFQMICAERAWCDFVSFRPDLPKHLQLFVIRFQRDETKIKELTTAVIAFLAQVDEMLTKLKGIK